MDLRDIYPGLNGLFSDIVVILCTVALAIIQFMDLRDIYRPFSDIVVLCTVVAIMFSTSKGRDLVCGTHKNAILLFDDDVDDVNLVDLWKHICVLGKLTEKENHGGGRSHYAIFNHLASYGTTMNIDDFKKLAKLRILADLVAAFTLHMDITKQRNDVWYLTEIMYDLAILLRRLSESPGPMQDVIEEARTLIVKGAEQSFRATWIWSFSARSKTETLTRELDAMYLHIITQFTARVFTPMPHPWRSHLSEKYRTHAEKVKDVNLDDLWEHIFQLWKLRQKGKHDEARCVGPCTWPHVPGLHKLKDFVSIGTDLPIEEIYGTVKATLDEIGRENAATAAPLVVSHTLERLYDPRLYDPSTHTGQFFHLVTEMYELAIVLEILSEIPEETRQDATALIVEGARVFFLLQGACRGSASKVPAISRKLKTMKRIINTQFTVPVLRRIQRQLRSQHSKEYATHTENELWEHIFKLWELREEGNHEKARSLGHFPWPNVQGWRDLKEIVLLGAEYVETILTRVNVASVAPLVVAHTLERLDASITNTEELWHLIEVMYDLAILLEELSESSGRITREVMQEATSLIIKGARVFSLQGDPRRSASEAGAMVELLHNMYIHIKAEFTFPFLTPIHPRHAVFKMEALEVATNNFHEDNKVGEGGCGAVYKGTTDNGKQIAVKKVWFTSNQGRKQFMNEKLLAKVKHPNLVKLLGFCEQESQGFIVYKYLPKGSLHKFLFDPEKRKELDWHIRYNIILGIARGLCYLHEDSQLRIVHRDIKPSNILLDKKLIPKIADFGTANVLPEDWTHVTVTTRSRFVTYGYMPLEYIYTGKISERTDVYSFGIVLLEILFGEKISSEAFFERVWSSYKSKKVADTIDRTITETSYHSDASRKGKAKAKALRCLQVGLLCIQKEAELRPTMSQVITMLSSSESLPVPTEPLPLLFSSRRRSWF